MSEPLFEARGLRVMREGRVILELPELSIPDGQVSLLMGPNGAGKTTLLMALAQLLPSEGRVTFLGREVGGAELSPAQLRRQVTLVAQDPYLLSGSVARNIGYGLALRGLGREERIRRAEQALEAVGLAGFLNRRARGLSGGERQRVALARALALRPRALLLDEPFSSLDLEGGQIVERLVASLPERGCAVLLVTHDPELAARLAQSSLRLERGRLG